MRFLLRYNRQFLFLMVLLALLLSGGLTELRVSHKMDDYFSGSGDDLAIYSQYREVFGDDDQFILISIQSDSGIYQRAFLETLLEVKSGIRMLKGVEEVFWIDDWMSTKLRLRKRFVEKMEGYRLFVSEDHRYAAFLVMHEHVQEKAEMADLIRRIREELAPFPPEKYRIAGKIQLTTELEKFMKEDSGRLFLLTFGLIVGILFFMLGSFQLMLISFCVPLFSILFTMGMMGYMGYHINLFTTLIPTLILIISVSDILHLLKGAGPSERIARVKHHLAALLLTTLSTAIGFASLMIIPIPAVIEFGAFVAIGVIYTFLFTLLLFTVFPFEKYQKESPLDRMLTVLMKRIKRVYCSPRLLWILLGVFTLIVVLGIPQLKVNSFLVVGVPEHSTMKQDALHFDEKFAGTRPLSIWVEKKDRKEEIDPKLWVELDSLIQSHLHTSFLIGPQHIGAIPIKLSGEEGRYFRYYGLMKDVGSKVAIPRFDSLSQEIAQHPVFSTLKVSSTGLARMLDKNTTDISWNIGKGLFIAIFISFFMLWFYFNSFQEAFISVLVNIIPLLILAAAYGLLGIELRAGTSVVFTIAFGIAIDDSMHILASYKKLKGQAHAFDQIILDSGKPILMTTLVFSLSFSVLILSGLEAVHVLGLSMFIGCIIALLADVFVLPALLKLTIPHEKKIYQATEPQ
ncbi:MAG: MMPL family transporter [Bacteroidota bacterium]